MKYINMSIFLDKKVPAVIAMVLCCLLLSSPMVSATGYLTEIRASYFHPNSSTFRNIYSNSEILYAVEVNIKARDKVYPWISLGYLYARGSTRPRDIASTLYIAPAAVGIKYFFIDSSRPVRPYVGAGMLAAYANAKSKVPGASREENDTTVGAIAKTGILIDITPSVHLDLFADFTSLKVDFTHDADQAYASYLPAKSNFSGWNLGAGVVYQF